MGVHGALHGIGLSRVPPVRASGRFDSNRGPSLPLDPCRRSDRIPVRLSAITLATKDLGIGHPSRALTPIAVLGGEVPHLWDGPDGPAIARASSSLIQRLVAPWRPSATVRWSIPHVAARLSSSWWHGGVIAGLSGLTRVGSSTPTGLLRVVQRVGGGMLAPVEMPMLSRTFPPAAISDLHRPDRCGRPHVPGVHLQEGPRAEATAVGNRRGPACGPWWNWRRHRSGDCRRQWQRAADRC
jgi:hypothetical protein